MSEGTERSGSCLCGAVRLTAKSATHKVGACHCGMCRTWGGGPYLSVNSGTDVGIEGEEHVRVFSSSQWAESTLR